MSADLIRGLADAFNARDWDRARQYLSDDLAFTDVAMGHSTQGPDDFLAYAQVWANAFSDMQLDLRAAVGDESHVAGEFVGRGTHDGVLMSPNGEIPPSGRDLETPFTWFCDVAGGKLVRIGDYYDAMTIMSQLGLAPAAAEA